MAYDSVWNLLKLAKCKVTTHNHLTWHNLSRIWCTYPSTHPSFNASNLLQAYHHGPGIGRIAYRLLHECSKLLVGWYHQSGTECRGNFSPWFQPRKWKLLQACAWQRERHLLRHAAWCCFPLCGWKPSYVHTLPPCENVPLLHRRHSALQVQRGRGTNGLVIRSFNTIKD